MDFIIACIECFSCHYVESGVHKVECSSEARDGVVFIIMEDANPRPRARSACRRYHCMFVNDVLSHFPIGA